MEATPLIKRYQQIRIDDCQFGLYIYTGCPSYEGLMKPLVPLTELMRGVLGVKNPRQHPFFTKNKDNSLVFDRFTRSELPEELASDFGE